MVWSLHRLESRGTAPAAAHWQKGSQRQLACSDSILHSILLAPGSHLGPFFTPTLTAAQVWTVAFFPCGPSVEAPPRSSSQAGVPAPSCCACWLLMAQPCPSLGTFPERMGVPGKLLPSLPKRWAKPMTDRFRVQKPGSFLKDKSAGPDSCQSSSSEFPGWKEEQEQAVFPPKTPYFFPPGKAAGSCGESMTCEQT